MVVVVVLYTGGGLGNGSFHIVIIITADNLVRFRFRTVSSVSQITALNEYATCSSTQTSPQVIFVKKHLNILKMCPTTTIKTTKNNNNNPTPKNKQTKN